MLLTLVRSELARHLRSYRLLVLGVGGPVLVVAATLASLGEAREHRAAWTHLSQAAARAANLERVVIPRPLPTVAFLSAASREQWGEAAIVRTHLVDVPEARVADRSYLFVAQPLDWGAVVIFFYSLMAVVLSYDAVAGEKAAGTLRLVASRPVGRLLLILSKILSGFLVVAVSLLLGVLAGLAVALAAPGFDLDLSGGAVLVLATVEMLAFLLVSVLVGIAASVSASTSETALQRALGVWVVLAVVVPGVVVVLGAALHPAESELVFQRNQGLHQQGYWHRLSVSSVPVSRIANAPGLSSAEKRRRLDELQAEMRADQEAALMEMEEGYADLRREHLLRSAAQEEWIDRWSALSPHSLLRSALDRLALAGAAGRREFRRQTTRYEPAFTAFVIDRRQAHQSEAKEEGGTAMVIGDDGEEYVLRSLTDLDYSAVSVAAGEMPRFTWRPPTVGALVARALSDLLWMLLFVAVLVTWAFWRFAQYDCR